jgi:P2-related tail formation protein
MNAWESIFVQSPVNESYYDDDALPYLTWNWSKETWLQTRLTEMRRHLLAVSQKIVKRTGPGAESRASCA